MDDSSQCATLQHGDATALLAGTQAGTSCNATLLPLAVQWYSELPADARPELLAALFPGMVNKLALVWPEPNRARDVLDELLMDRRGGRRGFPTSVFSELLRLHELIGKSTTDTIPLDIWL